MRIGQWGRRLFLAQFKAITDLSFLGISFLRASGNTRAFTITNKHLF
jgi:hypothetical protein